MEPAELVAELKRRLAQKGIVTGAAYVDRPKITIAKIGPKRPFPVKGFPRGELLVFNIHTQESVWLFDAYRLLTALNMHGIV